MRTSDFNDGGRDRLEGGAGDDLLIGGSAGDAIDGDTGDDLIFGDQVSLERRVGDTTSLRFQARCSALLYALDGADGARCSTASPAPIAGHARAGRSSRSSTSSTRPRSPPRRSRRGKVQTYGDDYITGGAGDDMIFGQLGNDVLLGDGALEDPQAGATRLPGAERPARRADRSPGRSSALSDGDDYIEGGGGDDVIFGGLGQDDLIGGSSTPVQRSTRADQRPDGRRLHLRRRGPAHRRQHGHHGPRSTRARPTRT